MNLQEPTSMDCPYCGERIEILIDCSVPRQSYIEDCSVCCKPISLDVSTEDGIEVVARREDE